MAGIGPVIPLDLEPLAALLRRPGVVGDDRDAAQWLEARRNRGCRDLDDALDTADRQRVLRVERLDLAAIDRAPLDRGMLHARNGDVDAVDCPATNDVLEIDSRARLAD